MFLVSSGPNRPRLVLASASATRAALLEAAGVAFERTPASVDEGSLRAGARDRGEPTETAAMVLAEAKALTVGLQAPDALVIGADQILDADGVWFEKAPDRSGAADALRRLRGRRHRLVSAAAVAEAGRIVWREVGTAELVMRPFDDAFLDRYLDAVGDDALSSVGGYQIEGLGIHLFERIDGDHFTILGLPLLALLDFLRRRGVLDS